LASAHSQFFFVFTFRTNDFRTRSRAPPFVGIVDRLPADDPDLFLLLISDTWSYKVALRVRGFESGLNKRREKCGKSDNSKKVRNEARKKLEKS
jgi:hypothetical protein